MCAGAFFGEPPTLIGGDQKHFLLLTACRGIGTLNQFLAFRAEQAKQLIELPGLDDADESRRRGLGSVERALLRLRLRLRFGRAA